jgi:hypothetical protein
MWSEAMRVYVETTIEVPGEKGRKTIYSGPGFFEVDDEVGEAWIDEGKAKPATNANEIIEPDPPPEPEPEPELVDPNYSGVPEPGSDPNSDSPPLDDLED